MESLEEYDVEYKEIASSLSDSYYVLEDVTKRLGDLLDDMDFDGNRLLQVESRLDLIHSITRKYGGTVDDVLHYFSKITDEYNHLTGADLSEQDLESQLKSAEYALVELAGKLSQERHRLATVLEEEIRQELQDLYMEKARFQVQFSKAKFSRQGNEQIEFCLALCWPSNLPFRVVKIKRLSFLMKLIQVFLAVLRKPLPKKYIKSDNMVKCLLFRIYLRLSPSPIINFS